MDWEKLNDTEKEMALVATNTEEIYPLYLNACHACANAAIKGTLTEEKAVTALNTMTCYRLPVAKRLRHTCMGVKRMK